MAATSIARSENRVAAGGDREPVADHRATKALSWLRVGLGTAELIAPRRVAQLLGLQANPRLVRWLGARQLASGMGMLVHSQPSHWAWSRVAGDLLDFVVLRSARARTERGASAGTLAATAVIAGTALTDIALSMREAGARGTSVGTMFRSRSAEDQLVHFLSDMYSVEQQALAQLITAPEIAGVPKLAEDFRTHYVETEQQADMVRERLEALGGSPSTLKDAVMRLGGKGFLLFARVMPETPGRLVVHAFSYEAMEWAGYEMLIRFAERAGDGATLETARIICDQERRMMRRLEDGFDAAEEVSHANSSQHQLRDHLIKHLAEVHAFENQNIRLLTRSERITGSAKLAETYSQQLHGIRRHARQVEQRLEALHAGTSKLRDAALALGGVNWGLFFQAQSDTPAKLAAFIYAVLHLEIGGYELLQRTARRIHDMETEQLCENILSEKRAMAERLTEAFDAAVDSTLAEVSPEQPNP